MAVSAALLSVPITNGKEADKPNVQAVTPYTIPGDDSILAQNDISNKKAGIIREVTAYNAGDPSQTDDTPCDGAYGNICQALEAGKKVCAANFDGAGPHALLYIEGYGECEVLDTMNKRFGNRVDIAFKANEKEKALKFGKKNLRVVILEKS